MDHVQQSGLGGDGVRPAAAELVEHLFVPLEDGTQQLFGHLRAQFGESGAVDSVGARRRPDAHDADPLQDLAAAQRVHHVLPVDHFSEYRIHVVQLRGRAPGDHEAAAAGVRSLGQE